MAKSKHAQIITGDQIVVVTPTGKGGFTTHLVPAGNLKRLKNYSSKLSPDKRSQFFEYDPAHPEMSHYIDLANASKGKAPANAQNDMAIKKMVEKNAKLEETNQKLADQMKEQAKTLKDLQEQLAAMKKTEKANKETAK